MYVTCHTRHSLYIIVNKHIRHCVTKILKGSNPQKQIRNICSIWQPTTESRKILVLALGFLHEFATNLMLLSEKFTAVPTAPAQHGEQFEITDIS